MPPLTGTGIAAATRLFRERGVQLHHACQLGDLDSYLKCGGIAPRSTLAARRLFTTPFESDGTDKAIGVWDKVFFNLRDFGDHFAIGHPWTPTAYGPILLSMRPTTLDGSRDTAVSRRSASGTGFDRETEALSVEEIDDLFSYPIEDGRASWLKTTGGAQPEVSCSFDDGVAPFTDLTVVTVDPHRLGAAFLTAMVEDLFAEYGVRASVRERTMLGARGPLFAELSALAQRCKSVDELEREGSVAVKEYLGELRSPERGKTRVFKNWLGYLRAGTFEWAREWADTG